MNVRAPSVVSSVLTPLIVLSKNGALGAGAGYVLTIVLARVLGPAEFGVYSYILIVSSVCGLLISFGTDATAPAQYAQFGSKQLVFASVISARFMLFGVFVAALAAWSLFSPTVAFGVLAASMATLNLGFLYEISKSNVRFSYITLTEKLVYVAAAFLLVFLDWTTVNAIFSVMLAASGASLMWQVRENFELVKGLKVDVRYLRQTLTSNTFLVLASLATFAYGGFSRLILEGRLGLPQLGVYSAGWQLILAATIFQAQVDRVWRLPLSSDIATQDAGRLCSHVRQYLLFATLPVTLLAAALALFAREVVDMLYGNQYRALIPVLPVIAAYFVVINLDGLARIFWVALGRFKEYSAINLAIGVALLISLAVLPASYGLRGFAILVTSAHGFAVAVLLGRFYQTYFRPLNR